MKAFTLPQPLGNYHGKKYSRYTVRVTQSDLDGQQSTDMEVVAESAAAACNLVRDDVAAVVARPTEIECAGPQGGITHRFIGWESLVVVQMSRQAQVRLAEAKQMHLFGERCV